MRRDLYPNLRTVLMPIALAFGNRCIADSFPIDISLSLFVGTHAGTDAVSDSQSAID
jgi:hypothetical protein